MGSWAVRNFRRVCSDSSTRLGLLVPTHPPIVAQARPCCDSISEYLEVHALQCGRHLSRILMPKLIQFPFPAFLELPSRPGIKPRRVGVCERRRPHGYMVGRATRVERVVRTTFVT